MQTSRGPQLVTLLLWYPTLSLPTSTCTIPHILRTMVRIDAGLIHPRLPERCLEPSRETITIPLSQNQA
jgi:hypothetical protein